ncbi:hypothetical protein NJB1507_04990 [Mycobacterium marinum]|nr:hypothetical protein NJB1507_04990 [Mycobacterium marinum]
MRTPKTAGKRLIESLSEALPVKNGKRAQWTEQELVILGLVEACADRVEVLKRLFDREVAKPDVSTRRVTELSAEIRQGEVNIGKWTGLLDVDMSAVKSSRHQYAANVRWLNRA